MTGIIGKTSQRLPLINLPIASVLKCILQTTIYIIILLNRKRQATILARSSGRYLKLSVSTVIPFYHAFASQFGLVNLYRQKKNSAKTECSVDRQVALYDHWHGHCSAYRLLTKRRHLKTLGFHRAYSQSVDMPRR